MPRIHPVLALLLLLVLGRASSAKEDGLERVLGGLASPRPETRRACLARLGAHLPLESGRAARAVRGLADVLRRRPPDEGALAVGLLARLPGDKARQHWLDALDPDAAPRVFAAAIEATVHRADDADAVKALLDRARDGKCPPASRALALEALGVQGGAAARLLLRQPTGPAAPEPWVLASGRALGLLRLGGRPAAEALLDLLGHADEAVRVHAWEGLVVLTRQALPAEAKVWRTYLQAHPDAGRAQAPAAPVAPASGGDRYTPPEPAHVPRYYGVPISRPASHVVFCLDVSQSMYGRGIEQARSELTRTLKSFPSTYAFDVIAFNERLFPFAEGLVPAHPVVKARALRWLAALETISYTNLFDAVEAAFGYGGIGTRPHPSPGRLDMVFLLSDGAPNRGRYRREDQVVREIAALSRRRIPVHAVAAGEEVFPLLQRIARETGGRFVDAFEFE